TSYVIPPATKTLDREATLDIFKEPPDIAGDLLWSHLRWTAAHEETCNFTSWTSSLLFALQYGLFMHRGLDFRSKLYDIHLLIIDTRKFPKGTFVKDLEIMRA